MGQLLQQLERGIDRAVGILSPKAEMQRSGIRMAHRQMSRFATAYDGAKGGRRWHNRAVSSGSADADLDGDTLETLRMRSRDRYRNDAIARAALNSLTDNVVGVGFRPQLRLPWKLLGITEERARDLAAEAMLLWEEWGSSKACDSTGRCSILDQQALWFSQVLLNGDAGVAPVMIKDPRSRFELKLETIEADRIDTPMGLRDPSGIRNGVELGQHGQPIAYWVAREHPGDELLIQGRRRMRGKRKFRRIPAFAPTGRENLLHLCPIERPGQSRGAPLLAPVLDLFKDLDDYFEAELVAAQVAACFAVFITTPDPWGTANSRVAKDSAGKKNREEEISPGGVYYQAPGEEVSTANPGRPNAVFEAFILAVTRRLTGALGIPYEVALRDFSGTTYSQARASLLEARRMFARRQRWLIAHACQPVWRMLLEEAWLKGLIDFPDDFAERIHLWTRTHWVTPGFGLIDPDKEAKAMVTQLEAGVTTRAKLTAAIDGDTVEDVTEQLGAEERMRADAGLAGGGGSSQNGDDPTDGDDPEGDPDRDPDRETETEEELERELEESTR